MSKRKNPRLVKVQTILPAENVKEILVNDSLNAIHVKEYIKGCSVDIRKNDDDNTALVQRDLSRLENVLEKLLYISCISLLINVVVLCIC